MQLIPNWQSAWRFSSVQASVLLGFFDAAGAANWWGLFDKLGPSWFGLINAVFLFIIIPLLRVKAQEPAPVSADVKAALVEKAVEVPVKP